MRKSNAKHEPAKDASGAPQHTYPQTSAAPQARRCATRRRAPRMAVGGRPRIGAIRSSFCARLTKAASPN